MVKQNDLAQKCCVIQAIAGNKFPENVAHFKYLWPATKYQIASRSRL